MLLEFQFLASGLAFLQTQFIRLFGIFSLQVTNRKSYSIQSSVILCQRLSGGLLRSP
jgi:hypothetical protein